MKKFSFIIVFLVLIAGGALAWWLNGIAPVNSHDNGQVRFSIKKGEGVKIVANNLKKAGLIRNPVIFFLVVKQLGLDSKIQAGDFLLSPALNSIDTANALRVGTSDIMITIPEGKRAEEVADLLKERFSTYDESWKTKLKLHEGYLFPDTYSLSKDATIDQIVSIMLVNFENKYNSITNSQSTKLSKEDVVILASLVEREAQHDADRKLVASVIINRVKKNMPLQIDATVQYVLGYQNREKTWWKKDLTYEDLKIDSPYNTYTNQGFPPRAIANPGFKVLNAVINPAQTDYLFYISDKSGSNHYAKTFEEHNALIKKYGL